ncbi:class I SAM-dependent methyltransferase [Agrobacterium salinitolerans]|nr:class I SAM-dependent methyltransferase [Agrobacterium salinitolerans]
MTTTDVLLPAEAYDLAAPFYDTWSWQAFWREHEFPLIQAEIEASGLKAGSLIDLGCGTGYYLGQLAQRFSRSVGVDISEGMLGVAVAGYPNVEFLKSDLTDLPFDGGSFDVVLSCRTMTHLSDPRKAIGEIARLLRPGGIAIITNIDHGTRFGNTRLPVADDGVVFTTTFKHAPDDISAMARVCGLERTRCVYLNMYGEPMEWRPNWDDETVGSILVFRK